MVGDVVVTVVVDDVVVAVVEDVAVFVVAVLLLLFLYHPRENLVIDKSKSLFCDLLNFQNLLSRRNGNNIIVID